jgi:hypothetical protein
LTTENLPNCLIFEFLIFDFFGEIFDKLKKKVVILGKGCIMDENITK